MSVLRRTIRRMLFGPDEDRVACDHEDYGTIGHETLRENDLFYEVYDRPAEDRTYWSERNAVYVKLRPWEVKYVCTMCGKVFEYETAERVGGEDGIRRKVDGERPDDVTVGAWRRDAFWYEDNREAIASKYYQDRD